MGDGRDHLEYAATELIRSGVNSEEHGDVLVGMGYQEHPELALPYILRVLIHAGEESCHQIYLSFLDYELAIPSEVATLAFIQISQNISRHAALACLKIYLKWEGPRPLCDYHVRSLRDLNVRWGIVEATYGDHEQFHIFRYTFRRIGMLKHMDLMVHKVPL